LHLATKLLFVKIIRMKYWDMENVITRQLGALKLNCDNKVRESILPLSIFRIKINWLYALGQLKKFLLVHF
jgi:hypothetical protein